MSANHPTLTSPIMQVEAAAIELKHWQLRDLVRADSDRVVYPGHKSLHSLAYSGERRVLATLPVSPHCIAYQNHFALCGGIQGSSGQVAIVDTNQSAVTSHKVGEELINAVQFSELDTVLACSNDGGVYASNIANGCWQVYLRIDAGMPVNNISVAGTLIAVVGDKSIVQVYDRTQHVNTLTAPLGAEIGSSIAFSDCGLLLAGAFQGGFAALWDMRNMSEPLSVLYSTIHARRRSPGAFRTAKFAGIVHDAVYFTEEHGCVHRLHLQTLHHGVLPLDGSTEFVPRSKLHNVELQLPDTLGMAWTDYDKGTLVVGSTQGMHFLSQPAQTGIPSYEFR